VREDSTSRTRLSEGDDRSWSIMNCFVPTTGNSQQNQTLKKTKKHCNPK
jgi:hypothetical protein